MSEQAQAALLNIGTRRQGATVNPAERGAVAELQRLGLVGPKGGLTAKGARIRGELSDKLTSW